MDGTAARRIWASPLAKRRKGPAIEGDGHPWWTLREHCYVLFKVFSYRLFSLGLRGFAPASSFVADNVCFLSTWNFYYYLVTRSLFLVLLRWTMKVFILRALCWVISFYYRLWNSQDKCCIGSLFGEWKGTNTSTDQECNIYVMIVIDDSAEVSRVSV